jgi:hypothetical protein
MSEWVWGTGAVLAGTFLGMLGPARKQPEWLLAGGFGTGVIGLLLMALLPSPVLGRVVVYSSIGGMVGSGILWYQQRRARADQ